MGFDWKGCLVDELWTIENAILPIVTTKSYPNWGTIVLRLGYDWGTIGTQLVPNWQPFTTKWINWRGPYYFIKLLIQSSISNEIVDRFTFELEMSFFHTICYTDSK